MFKCIVVYIRNAKWQLDGWREEFNTSRPHRLFQNHTPIEFANKKVDNKNVKDKQPAETLTCQRAQNMDALHLYCARISPLA
jgi:hypothetical protein